MIRQAIFNSKNNNTQLYFYLKNKYNLKLLTTSSNYSAIIEYSNTEIENILITMDKTLIFYCGNKKNLTKLLFLFFAGFYTNRSLNDCSLSINSNSILNISDNLNIDYNLNFFVLKNCKIYAQQIDINTNQLIAEKQLIISNSEKENILINKSFDDLFDSPYYYNGKGLFKAFLSNLLTEQKLHDLDFDILNRSKYFIGVFYKKWSDYLTFLDNATATINFEYKNNYARYNYIKKIYEEEKNNPDFEFNKKIKKYDKKFNGILKTEFEQYVDYYKKHWREDNDDPPKYVNIIEKEFENSFSRKVKIPESKYKNISGYQRNLLYFHNNLKKSKNKKNIRSYIVKDFLGFNMFSLTLQTDTELIFPMLYSNFLNAIIRKRLNLEKIPQLRKIYNGKNILYSCYNRFGTIEGFEVFQKIYNKINNHYSISNNNALFHDYGFVYAEFFEQSKFLTKSNLVQILNTFSFNELKNARNYFKNIDSLICENTMDKEETSKTIKQIRKQIYLKSKKEKLIDSIRNISIVLTTEALTFFNTNNFFTKSDLDKIIKYCNEMQVYNSVINPMYFISFFGKEVVQNIINNNIECVFSCKTIKSYSYFINYLEKIMKTKNNISKKIFFYFKSIDWKNIKDIPTEKLCEIKKFLLEKQYLIERHIHSEGLFYAKVEEKCSPQFLIAGDASVCCMSFGTNKSKEYALNKNFGILNIYFNNKIIANSVLWIDKVSNKLIVDNIEISPNYIDKSDMIKILYLKTIFELHQQYNLSGAYQGADNNDLILSNEKLIKLKKRLFPDKETKTFFSDASKSVFEIKVCKEMIYSV